MQQLHTHKQKETKNLNEKFQKTKIKLKKK